MRLTRVRTQIVAKAQMPLDVVRPDRKGMELMRADARRGILSEVPASGNAKLAQRLVAQCREVRRRRVERVNTRHHGKHIDDRLGHDAWNSRAPNVVELDQHVTERRYRQRRLVDELSGPGGIVGREQDEFYRACAGGLKTMNVGGTGE